MISCLAGTKLSSCQLSAWNNNLISSAIFLEAQQLTVHMKYSNFSNQTESLVLLILSDTLLSQVFCKRLVSHPVITKLLKGNSVTAYNLISSAIFLEAQQLTVHMKYSNFSNQLGYCLQIFRGPDQILVVSGLVGPC
jgi:nicotinamide riboside kinase